MVPHGQQVTLHTAQCLSKSLSRMFMVVLINHHPRLIIISFHHFYVNFNLDFKPKFMVEVIGNIADDFH